MVEVKSVIYVEVLVRDPEKAKALENYLKHYPRTLCYNIIEAIGGDVDAVKIIATAESSDKVKELGDEIKTRFIDLSVFAIE